MAFMTFFRLYHGGRIWNILPPCLFMILEFESVGINLSTKTLESKPSETLVAKGFEKLLWCRCLPFDQIHLTGRNVKLVAISDDFELYMIILYLHHINKTE